LPAGADRANLRGSRIKVFIRRFVPALVLFATGSPLCVTPLARASGANGSVPLARIQAARIAPKKVIIDTDPGTDDALAILLALNSPELDVRALTVVPGNVTAKQ
jgi:hypothetical protein